MTAQTRKRSRSQGKVLRLSSFMQKDAAAMHGLIRRGPSTMVFVFSTMCPHCHTYMPIWKRMCQMKGRKANMISMEASTYRQTPMSQGNPVSGVPAVLHVDQNGKVTPVDNPRDTRIMKTYVRNTPPAFTQVKHTQPVAMKPMLPAQPVALKPMQPIQKPVIPVNQSSQYTSSPPSSASRTYSSSETVTPSPLKPLPARGGNWSAMMAAAAQQAAPAAALLGAYAAFPMQRSSGLGPARRTRRRLKN